MTDVMIDIETLGNGKNAIPVQIGAVYFDRVTGDIGREFKANIDARDAAKEGCEFDADTVYWWLSQSREAIDSITTGDLRKIRPVFLGLYNFLDDAKAIWSHATFDFVIIQETYKLLDFGPLKYRKARDIRTLTDLAGVNPKDFKREGLHHDALDDAKFQVKYCVEAFKKLRQDQDAAGN